MLFRSPAVAAVLDAALDRALGELLPAKVAGYCGFLRHLEGFSAECQDEEKRIAARRRVATGLHDRMKARLLEGLDRAGVAKVEAGTFVVTAQASSPSAVVDDAQAVPREYEVVTVALDKRAILAALKGGAEVPGCRLVQGRYVRIR